MSSVGQGELGAKFRPRAPLIQADDWMRRGNFGNDEGEPGFQFPDSPMTRFPDGSLVPAGDGADGGPAFDHPFVACPDIREVGINQQGRRQDEVQGGLVLEGDGKGVKAGHGKELNVLHYPSFHLRKPDKPAVRNPTVDQFRHGGPAFAFDL